MNTDSRASVGLFISVDEWRDIVTWMHASLDRTEHSAQGHFLVECEGTRRTWVTTDGAQITVLRREGPAPTGLSDPGERCVVLVNSRFFRRRTPQDAVLTVTQQERGRMQTFEADGVIMTLPEHPGEFGDWRSFVNGVAGAPVEVDTRSLREACEAAAIVPSGVEDGPVHAWLSVQDGSLHLETPWIDYPWTSVDVPLVTASGDTAPALVEIDRLIKLLAPIDLDRTTLRLGDDSMSPVGLRAGDFEAVLLPVDRWQRERGRLEELLREFLGQESIEPDEDGDYPVGTPEGNDLWVRLHRDADPVSVQVFSVLATHVDPLPELFEELNSINAAAAHVKVIWASGAVMAEVDLVAQTLDLAELSNALHVVRRTADRYRSMLSSFFSTASDDSPADEPP